MQLSILIRNLNEAKSLQQTLLSLKKQQTDFEYETVVIDNESEDNSVEIATRRGCKVLTLKRSDFTFGHALNYGIEQCKGEIILILSAHVILLNEFFLQNIPQYFKDSKIAALRFVQPALSGQVIESLQNGPQEIVYSESSNFAANNWENFIVNHCAAIRRSCWQEVHFNDQIFASEDKIWALNILRKRYSILYNVPGFYIYTKPLNRTLKINREVIERAAKEMITGESDPLFSQPYFLSFAKKIAVGFRRISGDLKIHFLVHKGMKAYKNKYRNSFKKEF